MSYTLDGTTIRRPNEITERNSTQLAQHQALDGTIRRDYFGDNKRVWVLNYRNIQKTDHDTIKTIYTSYLSTATAVTWSSDETNYTITETNVHVDLLQRGFSVRGSSYLSDFDLILTEA